MAVRHHRTFWVEFERIEDARPIAGPPAGAECRRGPSATGDDTRADRRQPSSHMDGPRLIALMVRHTDASCELPVPGRASKTLVTSLRTWSRWPATASPRRG